MIFSIYSSSLYEKRVTNALEYAQPNYKPVEINDFVELRELLEKSSHTVICIHTVEQSAQLNLFKKYGLFDFLVHQSPFDITNPNMNPCGNCRRLKLYVLKGKGDSNAY